MQYREEVDDNLVGYQRDDRPTSEKALFAAKATVTKLRKSINADLRCEADARAKGRVVTLEDAAKAEKRKKAKNADLEKAETDLTIKRGVEMADRARRASHFAIYGYPESSSECVIESEDNEWNE